MDSATLSGLVRARALIISTFLMGGFGQMLLNVVSILIVILIQDWVKRQGVSIRAGRYNTFAG